jgi:hypothetical protein
MRQVHSRELIIKQDFLMKSFGNKTPSGFDKSYTFKEKREFCQKEWRLIKKTGTLGLDFSLSCRISAAARYTLRVSGITRLHDTASLIFFNTTN